jgi:hypothetical protein
MKIQQQSMQMRRGECRAWRAHSPCGCCSPFCAEAQDLCHTFMTAYDTFHAWTMSLLCAPPSEWAVVPPPLLPASILLCLQEFCITSREVYATGAPHAAVRLMPREIAFLCLLQAHPRRCLHLLPKRAHGRNAPPGAHCRLVANQNLTLKFPSFI